MNVKTEGFVGPGADLGAMNKYNLFLTRILF